MTQLLQNAAYGTVLILAVVILRRVLKDRLLPEARLALWAVCLFRLLTPAAPESVLSLWGLSRLFQRPEPAAPAPAPYVMTGYIPVTGTPAPATAPADPGISWETVLLALWIAVGVVLAARYLLSWTRTRRAVNCAIPLDRSDGRYSPLPKYARLREGPMEGAPLTFGAVRPTVVLSPGLGGAELDCVLAHEGVHARRRDNLWHYVMALALVVHWWNPAVWLMSRLLRRDIELSCDRAAVRTLGEERRAEYAQTLISLATQADGPAFCHTFGRKAAEERILSIMKFKKTSIIGVIFSLALVLAVTAAFASEPKEPDDTIVFHGQTFNRAGLSQGTLDWLDWYLTLTEEEQLAISYVPNELREDRDVSTQDAYSSVKVHTFVELENDITVDPDDVDLSMMKERLAQFVASGEATQAEADEALAELEDMLEQARRGEVTLHLTQDGGIRCDGTNPEVVDAFPSQGPDQVYYKDENGKLVPVDPDTVKNGYVLEDGNGVNEYQRQMELDEYKTLLDQLVKDGNMTRTDADTMYASARQLLEQRGEMADLYVRDDGSSVVASWRYPCTRADCGNESSHYHDGVLYAGTLPICTLADCGNNSVHTHNGVSYKGWTGKLPAPVPSVAPSATPTQSLTTTAPSTSCGVAGCTETRYHAHNEGRTILLSEPCPVKGCTITGNHIHGDVCYSCNGAGHDSGACDGSCYTYNTSTHHSESHHSESHH